MSTSADTPIPFTPGTGGSSAGTGVSGLSKASPLSVSTRGLRPALATRVLSASEDEEEGHIWYEVWVMDIMSRQEWRVKRRFSEFYQFREVLLGIRPSIRAIEFPPKVGIYIYACRG